MVMQGHQKNKNRCNIVPHQTCYYRDGKTIPSYTTPRPKGTFYNIVQYVFHSTCKIFDVVVVFFTLTDRASTIPSNIVYVVANPVRGLLDRKRSEEHLQSSNESKRKTHKKKKLMFFWCPCMAINVNVCTV